MRAILLILLTCLLAACMTAAREREAQCLGATITDVWETEQVLTSAEDAWHRAQRGRTERSIDGRGPFALSARAGGASSAVESAAVRVDALGYRASNNDEEARLYQRMVDARARHHNASKWYGLVAQRVQTRIEEDEMLYPVLGMLATSTAIVLYPLVRWNVRSVLWDGIDPDAEDDPVKRFCLVRLGEQAASLRP
jgi:hypothetical protein